ncbi:SCO2322 family protein [Kribbella sp. NPDC056345]|uniref:SCO2322 family protein n=1 Tax=Kribbella sp. NPDC056345 TaxID=3345789 RepID=UPI0035DAF96A
MTAKRTVRLVLSLVAGLLLAGTATTQAHAEDGFRFWGYYQWSSSQWSFAQKGPDAVVPADGSVEGWRYAVGGAKPRVPRAAGDFEAICKDAPAEAGKKRVAVVVDPGTAEDQPAGEQAGTPSGTCVVTDPKSNGAQVLAAVGPTRIEKGLTCGISGYPAKGCGEPVKDIKVPATDQPVQLQVMSPVGSSQGSTDVDVQGETAWWPYVVVGVILAALIAGGVVLMRLRRTRA